jgi:hypothetical protein
VQRDDRGKPVRVVVRVRHHHAQRPAHRGTLACRFYGADFDVVLIERKNAPGQVGWILLREPWARLLNRGRCEGCCVD